MKICPKCNVEMKENCYLEDNAHKLSDLSVVEKDDDLKKSKHPLKAAICKQCGYVELYVDIHKE